MLCQNSVAQAARAGKHLYRHAIIGATLAAVALNACTFKKLGDDLERYDEVTHTFSGTLTLEGSDSDSLMLVALYDTEGKQPYTYRVMSGSGDFVFKGDDTPLYFFAFDDRNKDLKFQPDEPFAWNTPQGAIHPDSAAANSIAIVLSAAQPSAEPFPAGLVDYPLTNYLGEQGVQLMLGAVTEMDDPLLSQEHAQKGLWEPYAFMEAGGAGIHFLDEYDPNKIPVMFVHGINGSPQNFQSILAEIDRSVYQVWFFSYPSGLRLDDSANGLYQFMEILNRYHKFTELHLVAHSMGGLVTRQAINYCVLNTSCDYLRSFVSISTPWDGVASAKSGVKYSPTVVPVWRDMDPDSEFVQTLFTTPLPDELPHYLVFGFRQKSIFGSDSSDGVIKLSSQLRQSAQLQSSGMRGFDEDHMGILSNQDMQQALFEKLAEHSR